MANIYRYLLFLGVILGTSCGSDKITEGVIEYDITYPNINTSKFMVMMFPNKMVMKFKNGKFKTIVTKGKAVRTEFISDCRNQTLTMAFQIFEKKLSVKLNKNEIESMLKEFPKLTYIDVKDSDTLAGFNVRKKEVVFEDISFPGSEIWYTNEIELENANWCYPYRDIEGILLQYDIERYGLRMHLKATRFKPEEVDDKEFQLAPDFKRVRLRDFEAEVKKMLNI